MVYTARIDVAPLKDIAIAIAVTSVLLIAAIILGQAGPQMLQVATESSFNCDDNNHIVFDPAKCKGVQLGNGVWSKMMLIETRQLNKHWYCRVIPFTGTDGNGINFDVQIDIQIQGRKNGEAWRTIFNNTEISLLPCPQTNAQCPSFILIYVEYIDFDEYGFRVRFSSTEGKPLSSLADVVFQLVKENPEFSKMALVLRILFLAVSIGVFAFHYLKLRGKRSYWTAWTDEQRLFVFLLIALVGFNNPFYPLEFIAKGWFLTFFGSCLELLFTCILFTFWFIIAQKLRSAEGVITFSLYLKLTLMLVAIYAIMSTVLFGLAGARDEASPIFGISDHITVIQVLYYITSALYITIIIILFATLVITIQPSNGKVQLRSRFVFFAVPTIVVIISVLVGIFLGTIGPFGRDAPSFVYYLMLYNVYVYLLMWGHWPVEAAFDGTNPTEGTKIFAPATHAGTYEAVKDSS